MSSSGPCFYRHLVTGILFLFLCLARPVPSVVREGNSFPGLWCRALSHRGIASSRFDAPFVCRLFFFIVCMHDGEVIERT